MGSGGSFTLLKLRTAAGLLRRSPRGTSGHANPVEVRVFQAACCLTEPGRCRCVGFSPPLSANVFAPVNAVTSFAPALQAEPVQREV